MRALRLAACLAASLAAVGAAGAQEPATEPVAPPAAPPAALAPAVLAPAAPAPFAVTLPEARSGVPGTWDLSRAGTNRRCVLTLAAEAGEAGQRVRFPAGCRRSVPVVAEVAGWLFTEGAVRLVDRNVRPVLAFARRPDERSYTARTSGDEIYNLVPLDIAAMRGTTVEPVAVEAAPAPTAFPGAPARPPVGASAGVYALDRYKDRDVCRLDLEPGGPVRLLPGCRDSGIAVFDPATWREANGRMTVVSRRGHRVDLVPTGDGGWRRDPETGVTFVLRRMEP